MPHHRTRIEAAFGIGRMAALVATVCLLALTAVSAATLDLGARSKASSPRKGACCMTCGGQTACITCQKGQDCKRGCARSLFDFTNSFPPGPLVACFGEPTR